MSSRQVKRAIVRRKIKEKRKTHTIKADRSKYPMKAQKGGPSRMLIHRNRKHRSDKYDYFRSAPWIMM